MRIIRPFLKKGRGVEFVIKKDNIGFEGFSDAFWTIYYVLFYSSSCFVIVCCYLIISKSFGWKRSIHFKRHSFFYIILSAAILHLILFLQDYFCCWIRQINKEWITCFDIYLVAWFRIMIFQKFVDFSPSACMQIISKEGEIYELKVTLSIIL